MNRHLRHISVTLLASAFATNCCASQSWLNKTQSALHAIRDTLKNSSPQYTDQLPHFMQWYREGYKKSLLLAKQQPNASGYLYTLAYYASGFADPHIKTTNPLFLTQSTFSTKIPFHYANILVSYRQGHFTVTHRETNQQSLPPKGANLIQCDNIPANKIINNQIIPYDYVTTPNTEAAKASAALHLFLDGNPYRQYPSHCVFEIGDREKNYPMHWTQINSNKVTQLINLTVKNHAFRIAPFGKNGLWISIPSLEPRSPSAIRFLSFLGRNASQFRHYKPLVIDVRGNDGGNSTWAKNILDGLFGKHYTRYLLDYPQWSQWKLSPQNIHYMKKFRRVLPYQIKQAEQALARGQVFYPQHKTTEVNQKTHSKTALKTAHYHHRIYFLMDHQCFSSCLLFATYLSRYPHTVYIGLPTDSQTQYGEVASIPLPAGATLFYTMKAFRHMDRAFLGPYQPQFRFNGDINQTKKLMTWVTSLEKHREYKS